MAKLDYPSWDKLRDHAERAKYFSMRQLFSSDKTRAAAFSTEAAGLFLDYSKNLINSTTMQLFSDLSREVGLKGAIRQMFSGKKINQSEQRAALHTLLRADPEKVDANLDHEASQVASTLEQVRQISDSIRQARWTGYSGKPIKHVVHLGIGGSYLGPHMLDEALRPFKSQDISCHYIANIDAAHITRVLGDITADETLVIIVSKSFTTLETMTNAGTARKWLLTYMKEADLSKHLIAITTNIGLATDFGISKENLLPIWDWVGGRYSLWSAVGLPLAIRYGFDHFQQLLRGAAAMDDHFFSTDLPDNMPMIMAWLGIWYRQFFAAESHAILPYDHGMRLLPDHLQQLDMESNGKSVRMDGNPVEYSTGPIIWGGEGSNGQHAFHQLLHQGTHFVSMDFILPLKPHHGDQQHHDRLVASCLSQSQALMFGSREDELNTAANSLQQQSRVMAGNRPSNTILMDQVTPFALGALIALYEHKVFCQAVIWQINPFDQWGVELGKELGDAIYTSIVTDGESLDSSTEQLIRRYKQTTTK
ncbi:MAG TPA: glucose-6-phosphate isomerase [Gammaproteobacteria bacterium]|nr:glucose-6-phosphate isomerase [Gammaproteobacteria bacterium]HIL97742.1 glucose-6-phosphate isomerase [Pseudomonadales bacterium]